jgi:hypothetical protein|mmetsp:Transcript_98995/g.283225  ORF Transcript_98995/g.283225 Transcript_98995/m.283225 type:complete len:126 (-) Transcript_98995:1727-2104(-)
MRDTLQMEDRTILTELTKTLEPMLNARRVSCINEFEKKYIDEVATIQKRNVEMEMEIPKLKKRLYVLRRAKMRRTLIRLAAPRSATPRRAVYHAPPALEPLVNHNHLPRHSQSRWGHRACGDGRG